MEHTASVELVASSHDGHRSAYELGQINTEIEERLETHSVSMASIAFSQSHSSNELQL